MIGVNEVGGGGEGEGQGPCCFQTEGVIKWSFDVS